MNTTHTQQTLTQRIEEGISDLKFPDAPSSLYDPIRYTLSLGGKRIRPYFTLSSCGMFGGDVNEAMPAALAMELLHNFTLLHDDIMDCAATRRGKPSVYHKWDASTAILSGDVMYSWAFGQLQHYGRNESYSKGQFASIMEVFLECAQVVCEGQAYDLEFEDEETVSVDEYLNMIRGKTAALISGSFKLGGIVAGAGEKQLRVMHELGLEIGTAFQIQDDLLDVIADPKKFGKKRGGDIREGKKTYLSILALQQSNVEQKQLLVNVFDKEEVKEDEIDKVISIYRSLGVIQKTRGMIRMHYRQAMDLLGNLHSSEYKDDLKNFLTNLINREY